MSDVEINAEEAIRDISPAKARILAKAIELFHEKGFERTTVRDIAAATGILSGSLFHHFKSKQEILFVVMAMTTQGMGQSAEAAVKGIDDPLERLRSLVICELNSTHRGDGHAAYVLVEEWRSLDETYRNAVLAIRDGSYEHHWEAAIGECKKQGLMKGDTKRIRQVLRGALSWTRNWYRRDGDLSLPDLADEILEMFLRR